MTDQFRERICFRWLERFSLDNQVVVAGRTRSSDQVDADRCGGRAVVSRSKLVDDRLHAIRYILRGLCCFRCFSGDDVAN